MVIVAMLIFMACGIAVYVGIVALLVELGNKLHKKKQ